MWKRLTGGSSSSSGSKGGAGRSPPGGGPPLDIRGPNGELDIELRDLPPFFLEVIVDLCKHQHDLGGLKNFRGVPQIDGKVKKESFIESYTDFEYVFLTILGLAKVHEHCEEITSMNNGKEFKDNPAVHMLETKSGMTMHGERAGANALLRSSAACLLEAHALAKTRRNGLLEFFREAFDRTADPCLEGRVGRLMHYLEAKGGGKLTNPSTPPWEDVSLRPLPKGTPPLDIVGEHLRVFLGECVWAWSRRQKLEYEAAKEAKDQPEHAEEFASLFNDATFVEALRNRGVVSDSVPQWECQLEAGKWGAYRQGDSEQIERAYISKQTTLKLMLPPNGWTYVIDLAKSVQRNPKSNTERPIRRVEIDPSQQAGKVSSQDLKKAVQHFIDLATLPARDVGKREG